MPERVQNLFGELYPDIQDRDNPGVLKAENVFPHISSYTPARDLVAKTNALDSYCLGSDGIIDLSGAAHNYAGSMTKLYELDNGQYVDKSRAGDYALSDDDSWEFMRAPRATLENIAIATNGFDVLQVQISFTGNFQDIVNNGIDSAPVLKHIAPVRGFVMGGNTPTNKSLLKWSGLNQYDVWDIQNNQAGEQTLPRGGAITAVLGGEYAIVYCEHSIYRVNYIGDPIIVFEISEVEPAHGTTASGSVAQYGYKSYFIDTDGFYIFDGSSAKPIGSNKLNKTFTDDYDTGYAFKVRSIVDLQSNIIIWAYPGQGHKNGLPNKLIAYDLTTGKFAGPIFIEVQELTYASQNTIALLDNINFANYPQWPELGTTGETDMDQVPLDIDVDDALFKGGNPILGAFTSLNEGGTFTGNVLEATIETGEYSLNPYGRAFVNAVRTLVDGDSVNISVRVGVRDSTSGVVVWHGPNTPYPRTELANFRSDARYHRFEVKISGDFNHLFGGEAEFERSGYA